MKSRIVNIHVNSCVMKKCSSTLYPGSHLYPVSSFPDSHYLVWEL